jgi:hypothetical protein
VLRIARANCIPPFMSVRYRAPQAAASVIPWYLSGGIAAANCLAAYTPKGAASLAASYDNNAAPGNGLPDGTYDCTLGIAPTWAAVTGWTFTATSGQYLQTGVVPTNLFSVIVRISGTHIAGGVLYGTHGTLMSYWLVQPNESSTRILYYVGTSRSVAPPLASGDHTVGVAGYQGYRDGVSDGAPNSGWTGVATGLLLGAYNVAGTPALYCNSNILSCAIYNTVLSAPQMLAVHTAMMAL